MKKKRYSLKDIANEFGVSSTTVSFILNGKAKEKRISEELTNKVLEFTTKINYRPNQLAQSLRTGRSKILVVMVEDIYSRLARIIEDIAYKKGYRVLFCSNDNEDKKSRELINLFRNRQVDGYIIVPSPGIEKDVKALINDGIPVVLFDRYFPELNASHVVAANKQATYTAVNNLIQNGFRKILFVTTDMRQTQMLDRRLGYTNAIEEYGLTPDILEISFAEKDREKRKQLFRDKVKKSDDFDAIFFATNYLAVSALELLQEEYPDYLQTKGFFSFDDDILFKLFNPSISAISQPLQKIGEQLMQIVLENLKSKDEENIIKKIELDCDIQYRSSSLPKHKS
ncbi:LacI family DNA-binding transcriptional regulator [Zunongwangia pacifica]|uniref:LacI family transcriptional regulator n=1 Tax=Zunongwangia pacifica TaxID=2911062 RepID=A0A9X1ZVX4_9FLAO|nr:LacI family DNA-binding transcriptional regulator [Zunongwangia pacifica]MCL6219418.1 LacI family transcriptional regulator [Zunongwangia pacifica]